MHPQIRALRAVPGHPDLPTCRPFHRDEALAAGVTPHQLARLVRTGELVKLFAKVYATSLPRTRADRALALHLAVPDGAIVTKASAAWLYGIDLAPLSRWHRTTSGLGPIDHTRLLEGGSRSGGHLTNDDVQVVDGCRVTTALRTACDLGRSSSRAMGLAAIDGLLRLGEFTQDDLLRQADRFRGAVYVAQLRELVAAADIRAASVQESGLRSHWLGAGLPTPELHVPVAADGHLPFTLGLADPVSRYGVVLDSARWRATPEHVELDDARRAAVTTLGWTIDVFADDEVSGWGDPTARLKDGYRLARTPRRDRTSAWCDETYLRYPPRSEVYESYDEYDEGVAPPRVERLRYGRSSGAPRYCAECGQQLSDG